jgi:hypothetical protein
MLANRGCLGRDSSSGRSPWLGVLPDVLILRLPLGRAWEFRVEHSTEYLPGISCCATRPELFLQVH